MMLSWTSLVPPSIELPLERSQSRGCFATHSSASLPPAAIISSLRRLFSSVPAYFIIDGLAGCASPAFHMAAKRSLIAAGGSNALEWDSERSKTGKAARDWLRSKGNSIEGGTSEIQLGIVAKHILRLPGA